MAQRQEIAAVYAGAVIQGVVLVAFPAVSAILTSKAHYGLSTTEYGGMFAPQAVTAILSSLLGAGLTHRIGGKAVLLIGLAADLISMALLFASQFATGMHPLAYGLLLAATACLGVGFGFAVPALNTFTAAFFPQKVDQAILTLNALLGVGTALAPIFATIFVGLGFWWGLPILMSGLTLALILFSLRLPLKDGKSAEPVAGQPAPARLKIPARFWLYAAFALLYGVGETMSGNWATVYMSTELGASITLASLALTVFWVTVTAGRVLFAAIEKWCPPPLIYRALPVLMALAFLATASVPKGHPFLGILSFALAGLGCSALLPLVISFGQEELTTMSASVAGGLIGFYQMGYGIAAFGVGPLQSMAGLNLAGIYRGSILVALMLAALAFLIVGGARRALSAKTN
jgi:MFS family permease